VRLGDFLYPKFCLFLRGKLPPLLGDCLGIATANNCHDRTAVLIGLALRKETNDSTLPVMWLGRPSRLEGLKAAEWRSPGRPFVLAGLALIRWSGHATFFQKRRLSKPSFPFYCLSLETGTKAIIKTSLRTGSAAAFPVSATNGI
jgi:hypothetical protein